MFRSLTSRAIVASTLWIGAALGLGVWATITLFQDSTVRQFDSRLLAQLDLLSATLAASDENPESRMTDPGFERVYSGLYWQVEASGEVLFRSRSLWDVAIETPDFVGEEILVMSQGPDGQNLRVALRPLFLPDRDGLTLAVGTDVADLEKEIAAFKNELFFFASVLAAALLLAAFLLLRAAFSPLKTLQKAVVERHTNQSAEINGVFPKELSPLVDDLNSLLERNERLREKGRVQAANLAHALKTPAALLRNEMLKARRGEKINLSLADQAVENVSAAADRHLSLTTASREDIAVAASLRLSPVVTDVVNAMKRVFPNIEFETDLTPKIIVSLARPEMIEILGNLVENAAKWADRKVQIKLKFRDGQANLTIDDDGRGVPEDSREKILEQGVRLDQTQNGSGLGLAIVADILDACDGEIKLRESALGGLSVSLHLPGKLAGISSTSDLNAAD